MKKVVMLLFIATALVNCKSIKQTTTIDRVDKDSIVSTYVKTVELDTTTVAADTASFDAIFDFTNGGSIVSVQQTQGEDVRIDYVVDKKPDGNTVVKVRAITREKEVVTQNITVQEKVLDKTSNVSVTVEEKKVKKNGSLWHLAWILPLGAGVYIVIKKWKTITSIF